MASEKYARIYSWGNNPDRNVRSYSHSLLCGRHLSKKGEYDGASPVSTLPQTLMEPLLLCCATLNGLDCEMDTGSIAFEEDGPANTIITTVEDSVRGQQYRYAPSMCLVQMALGA